MIVLLMAFGGCGHASGPSAGARQWMQSQGGLAGDVDPGRWQGMADELSRAAGVPPVTLYVLGTSEPGAFLWPAQGLFISAGLIRALSPDELEAAIAHELGHLALHEGCPIARAASLTGREEEADEEVRADRVGAEILARCGRSAQAMTRMLRKMRACRCDDAMMRARFTRRIAAMN